MKPFRSPSQDKSSQPAPSNGGAGPLAGLPLPAIAAAVWVVASLVMIIAFPGAESTAFDGLRFMLGALVVMVPPSLIGLAVLVLRLAEVVAQPAAPLVPAAPPRQTPPQTLQQTARPVAARAEDDVPPMPAVSMPPMGQSAAAPAAGAARPRVAPRPPQPEAAQNDVQSLSRAQMVRALNFPDSAEDYEGFDALSQALSHPDARAVVQSAQDILTLLSQDGLYMDDLRPAQTDPQLWRAFSRGQRGPNLDAIGQFPDDNAVARAAARLKADAIFRDTAQHFLRNFDRMFEDFEADASDDDILLMAETRSARAFMLIGRAAGTFG
ncbi:hypothetical protein BVG79_00383 [Ketogulonicigenium robustum]|uniref:Uncharacterized protein n=1 Tax=Ketogulonicigenium robustum TaxID=92947 RepID=A0A1W6NX19_9RHOB|nr:hypothetical protein [Ketogulonicigenium robustum]ARO13739.1 hypothetical protein BVG79_00383 [Ketogulonicigenium robustum]